MNDEDVIARREDAERNEVPDRIVRQLLQVGRDRERSDIAEEQRVTIGGGFGHDIVGDHAGCTRTIVDDDLLLVRLTEFLSQDARKKIIPAAWRKRNEEANGFCWIDLWSANRYRIKPGGLRALPANGPAANESRRHIVASH